MRQKRSDSIQLHGLLVRLSRTSPGHRSDGHDLERIHALLFEGQDAVVRRCIRSYFGQRPGYRRIVRRVYDEADLVSEGRDALMRALERGAYTGERSHPWGFVWKVVVRRMRDISMRERRRQLGRVEATETSDPLDTVVSDDESPLDQLVRDERRAAVARLLADLKEEERHMLVARYGWGMSYADLVSLAGATTTPGALRVRLHRIRGRLKQKASMDHVLAGALTGMPAVVGTERVSLASTA